MLKKRGASSELKLKDIGTKVLKNEDRILDKDDGATTDCSEL